MELPRSLEDLESRCWTLAGERVLDEALGAVARHATDSFERLLTDLELGQDDPVANLFAQLDARDWPGRLSQGEWDELGTALLSWATHGRERDRFLAAVDGLTGAPPSERRELEAWVEEHGIRERLADPVTVCASLCGPRARYRVMGRGAATIAQVLATPQASRDEVYDAARSYLAWAAGRRAIERERRTKWSTPAASPAVAAAVQRVRALLEELVVGGVEPAPLPRLGLAMGPVADRLAYALDAEAVTGFGRVHVWVSLIERHGPRAVTSLDPRSGVGRGQSWSALRICAEHALDTLLDTEDPAHEDLRKRLEQPRWADLLRDLSRDLKPADAELPFDPDERLVWRVEGGDDLSVCALPAIQKRRGKSWTKGRAVDVSTLLGKRGLDTRDQRAVVAHLGSKPGDGGALLRALVGHPRVVLEAQPKRPVRVQRASVEVALETRGEESWIRFRVGERPLEPHELLGHMPSPDTFALLEEGAGRLVVADVPRSLVTIAAACTRWQTGLPAEAHDALLRLLERLPGTIGVRLPAHLRGEERAPETRPVLRVEPLPGGGLRVVIGVRPIVNGPIFPTGEGPLELAARVRRDDGTLERVFTRRDFAAERRAAEALFTPLALDAGIPDGPHATRLDEPELALDFVTALGAQPELATVEWPADATAWRVIGRADWTNTRIKTRKLSDWFALQGGAELDEGRITLAQIMAALRDGRRYVSLGKGKFAAIEEEVRAQLKAAADLVFEDGEEVAASVAAIAQVEALLPEEVFTPDAHWRALRDRLEASRHETPSVPEGLVAELREYQREGVEWLLNLGRWAPGACLADDMGLGKTVMALALIVERAKDGPSLVVTPTSVGENWRREAARFTPGLRVRAYRGPDRGKMLDDLGTNDVLVTSYDLMLRDAEALSAVDLATLVFDEAQALKNPRAGRTQAARQLRAGFRLGLTGTPLENHLGELWSLFSVFVPGLLGPADHFRERFWAPIERDDDPEHLERLRSLLRPFLLRRTKRQVAPELPPRTEVVHAVELSEDERALYELERRTAVEALTAGRAEPAKTKSKKGRAKPQGESVAGANRPANRDRFAVLAALTRLRRLACHPALVDPESAVPSSKLAVTLQLAADLVADDHRTLVFSQFTSHLGLVRDALVERGHHVLYLDGSTPASQRDALVQRFQGGEAPFFLISLKAGGTGLNLTAADTVVHLDPWWNPAAEDQASDRAHRIGQDKPVTVVRLVAQDTIEERVLEMHAQKRELALGVLEGAEANAALPVEDLLTLLGPG